MRNDSTVFKKCNGEIRNMSHDLLFFQTLRNGEKMLRTWMIYSPFKNSLYCFCCWLFAQASKSSFASHNGWNSYWRLNPKVEEQESSQAHCMASNNGKNWKSEFT